MGEERGDRPRHALPRFGARCTIAQSTEGRQVDRRWRRHAFVGKTQADYIAFEASDVGTDGAKVRIAGGSQDEANGHIQFRLWRRSLRIRGVAGAALEFPGAAALWRGAATI